MIPLTDEGEIDLDRADEAVGAAAVKAVAYGLISNSLGTINPVERIAAWAHERGAIMVCDAAQAAPHRRVDVQALGADFVAVSGHKMCGPSGIGALWGRAELLERMSPFNLGGEMIRKVTVEKTSWNELPYKFEAGTPADRRGGRARRGDRLPRGDRPRGDRGARARADRLRARAARGAPRSSRSTGRRSTAAAGSSPSTSARSTRTTWRRSSTGRASRSAPATTARSRCCGGSASPRRTARASTSTRSPRRSTASLPASSRCRGRSAERRRLLPRDHPRPLQEPAQPRRARRPDRDRGGSEPALRRRGHDVPQARRRRRDDRGRVVHRPRLRDQPGLHVHAHRGR